MDTLELIMLGIIFLMVIFIIIILIKNKKTCKSKKKSTPSKKTKYRRKITKIIGGNYETEDKVKRLDKLTKSILRYSYHLSTNKSYSVLKKKLKEKNKTKGVKICEKMLSLKYSGKKTKKREIEKLGEMLREILKHRK